MEVWYEIIRSVDDYFYDFPRWRRNFKCFPPACSGQYHWFGLAVFGSAIQAPAPASYQYGWQFSLGKYDHSFSASSSWYHG